MATGRGYEFKQVGIRVKLVDGTPLYSDEQIRTPEGAVRVMSKMLSELDREHVCIVNMDNAGHPINFNIVSMGDANVSMVPMQNVFKSSLLSNASSILMLHNHPGAVNEIPQPSRADMVTTAKLMFAAEIMNIPLLDHIIVGAGENLYFSFKNSFGNDFTPAGLEQVLSREVGGMDMVADSRGTGSRKMHSIGRYEIYKLKDTEDTMDIRFMGKDYLDRKGRAVKSSDYSLAYVGQMRGGMSLDSIYEKYDSPAGINGQSISVSDIIVIRKLGSTNAYYVDNMGFTETPEFLKDQEIGEKMTVDVIDDSERDYLEDDILPPDKTFMQEVSPAYQNAALRPFNVMIPGKADNRLAGNEKGEGISEAEGDAVIKEFREKTEKLFKKIGGMDALTAEAEVLAYAKLLAEDYGVDLRPVDAVLIGDRSRGMGDDSSKLEVALAYKGSESAESIGSMLKEEELFMGGARIEIKPILEDKTGSLASFLLKEEQALNLKRTGLKEQVQNGPDNRSIT